MSGAGDPYGETCPFCGTAVPVDASACGSCHARKGQGGARGHFAKFLLGLAWFCLALLIVWFFGSLIFAPWDRHSHQRSVIELPWGGTMDLSLGLGEHTRCVLPVTHNGQRVEVTVADGFTCEEQKGLAALRLARAQRPDDLYGKPRTIRPTPAQERVHATARMVVACVLSVGATVIGLACFLLSVRLFVRLLNPPRRPQWLPAG